VIPNGVDAERFAPDQQARAETRARLKLSDDDLVAVFVGSEWDRKGLRFAIEGVAQAHGWHLLVVGDGDVTSHAKIAERHGTAARIHFVGGTSEPARYFAAADAFLLPTSYETFSLVSFEAAATGLPLLVGRVNGVEELVREGENGWFVERSAGDISERLRALGDPDVRAAMGAAARASSRRYGWSQVVDAYAELYAALVRDPSVWSR
jgi:UDP-glucose:(heptosyl)LPS alpha-1,3-glucosyltransferase